MTKRGFDVIIAAIGLVVLSPIFIICAVLTWWSDGWPILFSQTRVGLGGKHFHILKFRTMRTGETIKSSAITALNDKRITPVGKILRQLKLDELPQLINVLIGDMSFVGPRPEVPHLFMQYPEELRTVMSGLRPGITDFASLEYMDESYLLKNAVNPEQVYLEEVLPRKAAYILKYEKTKSFHTDVVLIIRTVFKLFD
jgi:lipopolysaccharide/colanic/teichoic acid biosynthesis glycosyltransferase